ncbi:sensor histidine kinase [Lentzea flaviverrucosa]|uniref:sensor histidine kinase n=1 Tax=Lentzea flaviverrucosa TaxID=200379 RepID=UPI0011605BEB|nr:histidine kinase [Lentzea flaviverrucosa]
MARRPEHSAVSSRLAYAVVSVVFANYLGNAFLYVLEAGATPVRIASSLAVLLAIACLQLGVFSRPGTNLHSPWAYAALGAQALLVFAPVPFFPTAWSGMVVFLAGSVLLVLRGGTRWFAFAAVSVANPLSKTSYDIPPSVLGYYTASSLTAGLAVYGLSRLPSLVAQLETARSEVADLAVTQERLGFAHDVQNLLGLSLAAIALEAGQARRMIGDHTGRALEKTARIIAASREALTDVRAVASSYRGSSLADEIESARSVLTAAGIVTTIESDAPEPSPRSRTAVATVLREGVSNLLRHSGATRCEITISGDGRTVTIDVVSDGTFRLHAEVPATTEPARRPLFAGPPIATRFARVLLAAVVAGYGVMATLLAAYYLPAIGFGGILVCAVSGAVTGALVLGFVSRPHVRPALGHAALAGIAVCVYVPQFAYGHPYLGGVPGFLAGAAVLLLPRWAGWAAFAVVVAGQGVLQAVWGYPQSDVVWALMATTNHGLVLYALTRLRSMVTELHEAREELATAAVTRERLRFARDLHDLLGYSLSAITLKSELTHRLASIDSGRARRELAEVAEISRQALADVRSVALSYRELSFDEETVSAQALLSAADIEVTVRIDAHELPGDVQVTLATVLREGVTNLLRHSKAEHCEITLSSSPDLVALDITNDGIPAVERKSSDGNGIGNLTTRVRALGGDLRAGPTPEHTYRLRAEIPLPVTASR